MKITLITAGAALLLASLNLVQCANQRTAAVQLQAMTDQRDALVTTGTACFTTGTELAQRLNACIRYSETAAESERAALAQRDAATLERDAAQRAAREQRRTLYATDATCAAWAAAPVCGAISDQLRAQWADRASSTAGGSGKAGAGAGAAQPDPDR